MNKGKDQEGKFTIGNNYGRTPTFKTAEELERVTNKYFIERESQERIPNIYDYALYIGFVSYEALRYYEQNKKPFLATIKKAKEKILAIELEAAMSNKINPTIFIFNAKNNHGMKDKTEQEVTERRIVIKRKNDD